jgi:hypothetical protein
MFSGGGEIPHSARLPAVRRQTERLSMTSATLVAVDRDTGRSCATSWTSGVGIAQIRAGLDSAASAGFRLLALVLGDLFFGIRIGIAGGKH